MAALPQLAKLSRPRLHDVIPRERLFSKLDALKENPCTWVYGRGGAGKTTLVASWLQERKLKHYWFHLDAGDIDLPTFFYYLGETSKQIAPRKPPLPLLTPEYLPDLSGFARRYFRDLFSRMPTNSVLIFDDVQTASGEIFDQVLSVAINEVPDDISLVAIGRIPPPIPLRRAQANNLLGELGWEELRLTNDEASEILYRSNVEAAQISNIAQRADGWAAGLILMATHLKRAGSTLQLGPLGTQEAVFEYFAAEVLDITSEEDGDLLIRTSIFPEFTPEIAVDLTENPRCAQLLHRLYQNQYFVDRRSKTEVVYRYHDLFREHLLARLHKEIPETELKELKLRAGQLLDRSGDFSSAIQLFTQGGHYEEAVGVILARAPGLLSQGRWQTIQTWIVELPESLVSNVPWLRYWLGLTTMQVDLRSARKIFGETYSAFEAAEDALGQALCAASILTAIYYEYDDFAPMDPWVAKLDRMMQSGVVFPDPGSELFARSSMILSGVYRQPKHPRLPEHVQRVSELIDLDLVDVNQRIAAAIGLLSFYSFSLQIEGADFLIARITPLLESGHATALNQCYWWLFVGHYLEARAVRYAEGRQYYDLTDKIAADNGLRHTEFMSLCFRAYSHVAWEDGPEIYAPVIQQIERLHDPSHRNQVAQFHLVMRFATLLEGQPVEAAKYARLGLESDERLGLPYLSVGGKPVSAAGLIMNNEFAEADALLEEAWTESDGSFLEAFRPLILLCRAYSCFRQGNKERWAALMQQALDEGKIRGIASICWVPGVKDLMLEEALKSRIDLDYTRKIIRQFRCKPPTEPLESWPWQVQIYTLGHFQILVDGNPQTFARKAPKKPIALLKALIAYGENEVSERQLADALWPNEHGDFAMNSLKVNLHRLRKLLGNDEAVRLQQGLLSLNAELCWTDVRAFKHALDDAGSDRTGSNDNGESVFASGLYKGHFLVDDGDEPWALIARERLRSQFFRHIVVDAKALECANKQNEALALYQRGIELDALVEEMYQGSMRCFSALGRNGDGLAVYSRLRHTLSTVLGVVPSAETEQLRHAMQQT